MDLKFERPRLVHEQETEPAECVEDQEVTVPHAAAAAVDDAAPDDDDDDDDESWRDEVVADIFDGPRSPKPPKPETDYVDWLVAWLDQKQARELEERSRNRRARPDRDRGSGAHVCSEAMNADREEEQPEVSDPIPSGVLPGG